MDKQEILEVFDKLNANIKMLNDLFTDYKGKEKGTMFIQNKGMIEKRIVAFREKIQHIGKTVTVVKVTYLKDDSPSSKENRLLGKAQILPKQYFMVLSDIDKEVALKWVKYLVPEATDMKASVVALAVEFQE